MEIRVKRIVDNVYYSNQYGHLMKYGDLFYPYCSQRKIPINQPISAIVDDDPKVEFQDLPTSKPLNSQKKEDVTSKLSDDQIKKPVAPGFVDDAYTAFTSGGG